MRLAVEVMQRCARLAAAAVIIVCAASTPQTAMAAAGVATPASGSAPEFTPSPAPMRADGALSFVACPAEATLPANVRCLAGLDGTGAHVMLALPSPWNGILVLHAHGGPFLGAPTLARVQEDLVRWSIVPRAGYAWAATSYHEGGMAVRSAGTDLESLRDIVLQVVGTPQAIVLHGQSWGADVAAHLAQSAAGRDLFNGVLLTDGVLAGGTRAYEHRLDLRVVYQYLCGNHPRPQERAYPLWMGLPEGSTLTREDLASRADECLGLSQPATQRTPQQAQRLRNLLAVVRIAPGSVLSELSWATYTLQDIARRHHGRSVLGNVGAVYRGSDDDQALNAGVQRYAADPDEVRAFNDDADLNGEIDVPVLTLHAIADPTAFVEMERRFGDRMKAAGHGATLVQTFSDDAVHSYVSDATYVALLDALAHWVLQRVKPSPRSIAQACVEAAVRFPSTCRFRPDYQPAPLESRVTERDRP